MESRMLVLEFLTAKDTVVSVRAKLPVEGKSGSEIAEIMQGIIDAGILCDSSPDENVVTKKSKAYYVEVQKTAVTL